MAISNSLWSVYFQKSPSSSGSLSDTSYRDIKALRFNSDGTKLAAALDLPGGNKFAIIVLFTANGAISGQFTSSTLDNGDFSP
jgi:hypothetical protein